MEHKGWRALRSSWDEAVGITQFEDLCQRFRPGLAAHALRAGLVEELQMFVCPPVVGAGKRFFPDGVRLKLELVEEHRFRNGVVVLRYAVRG